MGVKDCVLGWVSGCQREFLILDKTYVRRFERFKSTSKKKYQILWFSLKNTNTMFERLGGGGMKGWKEVLIQQWKFNKNLSNEKLKLDFVCKHKLNVFRDIHCTCGVWDASSWLKLHLQSWRSAHVRVKTERYSIHVYHIVYKNYLSLYAYQSFPV